MDRSDEMDETVAAYVAEYRLDEKSVSSRARTQALGLILDLRVLRRLRFGSRKSAESSLDFFCRNLIEMEVRDRGDHLGITRLIRHFRESLPQVREAIEMRFAR